MTATGRDPMTTTRLLGWTVAALVVFNLARGAGLFGPVADWIELVLAIVLVGVALRGPLDRHDLGLSRDRVRSGLLWGAAAFVVVLVVVVAGALLPATSGFLDDARADIPLWRLAVDVVVGIGLLTVVPEELLFRGVLQGATTRRWGAARGVVVASVLFGLWHVLPTLSTAGGNAEFAKADATLLGRLLLVAGAVVSTSVAGAVFGWLRLRSGSLLAPMIAHLSTNGVALVVAWVVVHRPGA